MNKIEEMRRNMTEDCLRLSRKRHLHKAHWKRMSFTVRTR